jgi:hypothetical protein
VLIWRVLAAAFKHDAARCSETEERYFNFQYVDDAFAYQTRRLIDRFVAKFDETKPFARRGSLCQVTRQYNSSD